MWVGIAAMVSIVLLFMADCPTHWVIMMNNYIQYLPILFPV